MPLDGCPTRLPSTLSPRLPLFARGGSALRQLQDPMAEPR